MKHPRARTKQKRGLKTVATQNMNKSPQGIKTSVSGKHFKPSLKLIRMRPRTASNHCKHRQPQTSENHEQNRLKAASNAPERLKIIMLQTARGTKKPRLQPTSQPQPTNQPSSQPIDRPTDGPATANQPNLPTNQPTNQQASQSGRLAARAPLSQHPENKRPAASKLEPLSAPQNEVHNL